MLCSALRLRELVQEDLGLLARLTDDPEVALFDGESVHGNWHQAGVARQVLVVELVGDSDELAIGTVICRELAALPRVFSLGICLDAPFRGQGLGKQIMRRVLHWLFTEQQADRVELVVRDYNVRAIRCYQAVGFRHEGLRRNCGLANGIVYGEILMGILRNEYLGG